MAGSNEQVGWSVAQHDTIPPVDLTLPRLEGHVYLLAFLRAEGEQYVPPYEAVREQIQRVIDEGGERIRRAQAPSADVEDQRIRTWKSTFEKFGLLTVDGTSAKIRLTAFGRAARQLYEDIDRRVEGANDHLAKLAITVLSRHLLRNPLEGSGYPEDSDVHPFLFMWRAMRELDDFLHWEEMNRVLMKVFYRRDEAAAIGQIRDVRKQADGTYDDVTVKLLGDPVVEQGEETKRRITPWFSRAGFGGLLITAEDDERGFRRLVPKYKPLIDEAIQEERESPPEEVRTSREAYLRYLTSVGTLEVPAEEPADKAEVQTVIEAVERYGSSRIICLSGIPATGKTRLAKLAAGQLVGGDPYRFDEIQFHESTSYDDFIEGFVPKPSGEGFELRPKTFRVINRRAKLDPEGARYVLLIEEFSRTNIHAVLGELITYVEHRSRPFRLPLSQEEEEVAPNLVILATMNPRDKSAVVLDEAILRRMHQVPLKPSSERLRSILQGKLEEPLLDQLVTWFEKHVAILPFGHAAFSAVRTETDLREIWRGTLRYFLLDPTGEVRPQYQELEAEYPWR